MASKNTKLGQQLIAGRKIAKERQNESDEQREAREEKERRRMGLGLKKAMRGLFRVKD